MAAEAVKRLRDVRLDALRGCFLILMTAVHVPTPISHWLQEPLGPNGAAEGFVFLSACLTGLIYGRIYWRSDWQTMSIRIWRRTWRLYYVHLAILLFMGLAILAFASKIEPLTNHFGELFLHPRRTLMLMPLLLYQPSLFDILPLYIIFLGLTPFILLIARRYTWLTILAISTFTWLIAQHQLAGLFIGNKWINLWQWTLPRPGSFDLFAWQLLWVVGVAVGEAHSRNTPLYNPLHRKILTALSLTIILIGALIRHQLLPHFCGNINLFLLMNKWTLGPLRLLNFTGWCVLLLVWNPRPPLRIAAIPALLGRHSLSVFCFHLPLVTVASSVLQTYKLSETTQIISGLLIIGLLFLWARWLEAKSSSIPLLSK